MIAGNRDLVDGGFAHYLVKMQNGITLTELLITLSLCAIVMGISAPGLRHVVVKQQGEKTLNTIAKAISTGRTAAIRSGDTVTVCRSSDGNSCSGSWDQGLIVFTDRNADRKINGSDQILQQVRFGAIDGIIRWRAFQNRQYLQINSRGQIMHQNGNFTYCPTSKEDALVHQILINGTGRIRFAQDQDGDGIREDSSGAPLSCQ